MNTIVSRLTPKRRRWRALCISSATVGAGLRRDVGLRNERSMRIIISIIVGLGIEVLFLVDVLGWISWCPNAVVGFLHYPSILLEGALFARGSVLWGSLPLATLQWPVIGAVVLLLHPGRKQDSPALQRRPDSAIGSNSRTGPAPLN